ncbi:hypothetical protein [Polaromonas sp. CG9_12]|nr:hypothetical protein [Polaromonas sp. CG9_12]
MSPLAVSVLIWVLPLTAKFDKVPTDVKEEAVTLGARVVPNKPAASAVAAKPAVSAESAVSALPVTLPVKSPLIPPLTCRAPFTVVIGAVIFTMPGP